MQFKNANQLVSKANAAGFPFAHGTTRKQLNAIVALDTLGYYNLNHARHLNTAAAEAHLLALQAGWWTIIEGPDAGTLMSPAQRAALVRTKLLLTVSEVIEGMEAHRKGLNDDKLPWRTGLEVELADAVIRIFDLAGAMQWDLGHMIVHLEEESDADEDVPGILMTVVEHVSLAAHYYKRDWKWNSLPGVESQLGMALLCIFRLCRLYKYDLGGAIVEKLAYNALRADHKIENRQAQGGKAY